jgi:hypothetical protein
VGTGQTGERFNDPHHAYATDLDLFGRSGLFELLSTARTRMGEETLARWLLSPSPVEQIGERHTAVLELRDQLDLKEDLAILGEDASVGVRPEALLRWAEASNQMKPEWIQWLALLLGISAVAGAVLWGYLGLATPFITIVLIEATLTYSLRKPLKDALQGCEQTLRDLDLLSDTLARVEQHSFHAFRLRSLQSELSSYQLTSSRAIARLRTVVDLSDSRRNVITAILDIPLMYSVQVAFAAERWRRAHGAAVRSWLRVIGEIEALLCFATYSYEHRDDPFPEFVEGAACFDGTEIGHPLIPAGTSIRKCPPDRWKAGLPGKWFEYVWEEYAAAYDRGQCCARDGWRAGAGAAPSAHTDASGRQHPGERFFAGGKLAFLCGDQTTAQTL